MLKLEYFYTNFFEAKQNKHFFAYLTNVGEESAENVFSLFICLV